MTDFDVIIADAYIIFAPVLIVGIALIFARMRLKRKDRELKMRPFSEEELTEEFDKMMKLNQEAFFDGFLLKRLGVTQDDLLSGPYDKHLKQIADFDKKQKSSGNSASLHPTIIDDIQRHLSRSKE